MKSEFKLIIAMLLIGLSAVAFSASLEAGALGDTVGGAAGAVGGALGGVGGALGGNSSSTSGGSTTAGAGDVSLGLTGNRLSGAAPVRRNRTAATQMFRNLAPTEQRKLVRKCSHVLASPAAFDSDLVALCRMIATLDSQPEPRAKPAAKKKTSAAMPGPERVAIMELQPVPSELKADRPEVTHCLGDFALSPERLAELEKDLPGCVVRH
jgi:hypothetical protein